MTRLDFLTNLNDAQDEYLRSMEDMLQGRVTTKHLQAKRIITFALAAALILGLSAVAYAIGISIHRKRQEKLRYELQIDENNVTDYVEFAVPEEGAAEGGLTLLSTMNNGDYQIMFFNISPVSEDMIACLDRENLRDRENRDDRVFWPYLYVDGEYYGILVNLLTLYRDEYDPETQTLTLRASLPNIKFRDNEAVEIRVALGYTDNNAQIHESASYGPVSIPLTQQRVISVRFPEPVPFENPETGGAGQIIGADIYAEGITWLVTHDDMESVYPVASQDDLRWLPWARARDKLELEAQLHFTNGSVRTNLAADRSEYWNGTVYDVYLFKNGTINLDQVVSITVGGKTFEIG
ncbi:MAG: hypothetical protein IKH34_07875 [Oscillospiraceae bacterium]|nr:hypothetical protein [Oscillospiraceae bacterium]